MIGVEWFRHGDTWHTLRAGRDRVAECGLTLLHPPKATASTEDQPVPPVPCPKCLIEVGMREVEDEPLDEALARGFLPPGADD